MKTKSQTQTDNILNLKIIPGNIPVTVSEHRSLNPCKGVIYCPYLNGIDTDEILDNLKSQKVVEIRKITLYKLILVQGKPTDTAL